MIPSDSGLQMLAKASIPQENHIGHQHHLMARPQLLSLSDHVWDTDWPLRGLRGRSLYPGTPLSLRSAGTTAIS